MTIRHGSVAAQGDSRKTAITPGLTAVPADVLQAALVLGISRDTLRYKLKKIKDDGAS